MVIKIKKPDSESVFSAAFVIWLVSEIIVNTSYDRAIKPFMNAFNSISNYVVLFLLIVNIFFFQKYTFEEIVKIGLISVFIVLSTILTQRAFVLSCWLFIVSSKNIDFDKIIRIAEKIFAILLPSIILLSLVGILNNDIYLRKNGTIRMSLGFEHPNYLGGRIFQTVACMIYNKRGVLKFFDYVLIVSATIFVYFVPNSQAGYISLMMILVLQIVFLKLKRVSDNINRLICKFMVIGAALANVISVYAGTRSLKPHKFLYALDKFLSYRFKMCFDDYGLFGISFFGQNINMSLEERFIRGVFHGEFLDNAYMSLLVTYGVVVYLLFSLGYLYNLHQKMKAKESIVFYILFVYSIYGILERQVYLMSYNLFMLSLGSLLYKNSKNAFFISAQYDDGLGYKTTG